MTAESQEKSAFIAEHLMLQDKHSMIILKEKASLGNMNRWLKR